MEFRILGPLEVADDGKAGPLGGPKQRAVLAMLLLHADEVVSRDRLLEALWGERPPPRAHRSLESPAAMEPAATKRTAAKHAELRMSIPFSRIVWQAALARDHKATGVPGQRDCRDR